METRIDFTFLLDNQSPNEHQLIQPEIQKGRESIPVVPSADQIKLDTNQSNFETQNNLVRKKMTTTKGLNNSSDVQQPNAEQTTASPTYSRFRSRIF